VERAISNALLLGTTNGGQSWQQVGQAGQPLTTIDFINPTTGWAVRGGIGFHPPKLLKTEDGGGSWTEVTHPASRFGLAVCFVDEEHGWLTGDDQVFRTVDGGQSWISVLSTPGIVPDDLKCVSPEVVWAKGFGGLGAFQVDYELYRTANDGADWVPLLSNSAHERLPGPPGPEGEPGPLAVADGNTAYFIAVCPPCQGDTGTADVVVTSDGGASWRPSVTIPGIADAWGMSCPDEEHCWVVGRKAFADWSSHTSTQPVIVATSDAGQTWASQYP
jgi:photosystem II stability/assembly factor-like uncharacterized protein